MFVVSRARKSCGKPFHAAVPPNVFGAWMTAIAVVDGSTVRFNVFTSWLMRVNKMSNPSVSRTNDASMVFVAVPLTC